MADFVEISGPEEHKLRLECCRQVLNTLFDNSIEAAFDENSFDEFFLYMTDVWSVIRKECARELTKNFESMVDVRQRLFLTALEHSFVHAISDTYVWQKLDGCLLAYNAIAGKINDDNVLDMLTERCFDFLGHMRIPIRNVAGELLFTLANKSVERRKQITDDTLSAIGDLISSQSVETEQAVVKLGCLLSIYDSITTAHQHDHLNSLYTSLASCMTHNASTVRQQAGHLLSNLLKSIENEVNSIKLDEIIVTVLQPALHTSQSWNFAESALIIMEDVLRSVKKASVTQKLLSIMAGRWDYLMSHDRFEVRRVVLQLLPIFCRCLLIHCSDANYLDLYSKNDNLGSSLSSLSLLLRSSRVSALLYEHRLLEECLSHTASVMSHLPWINVECMWGSEPRGRLQEAEQQTTFRSTLLSLASSSARDMLFQQLRLFDLVLISSISCVFDEIKDNGPSMAVKMISLDQPALWVLSTCFIQSYASRPSLLIDSSVELTTALLQKVKVQLEQAKGEMIQLMTTLQQLSGTTLTENTSSLVEDDDWLVILPPVSDPATNPALYARHHRTRTTASAAASTYNAVEDVEKSSIVNLTSTVTSASISTFSPPVTPAKCQPQQQRFSSPYGSAMSMSNTPKSPAPPSPNNLGPDCALTLPSPSYSALDRWMCEAIAPLLPSLCSCVTSNTYAKESVLGEHVEQFMMILIGWIQRTVTDPLWLDGRKFGKVALYDTLLHLVIFTCQKEQRHEEYQLIIRLVDVLHVMNSVTQIVNGDLLRIMLVICKCLLQIMEASFINFNKHHLQLKEALEEALDGVKQKVQFENFSSSAAKLLKGFSAKGNLLMSSTHNMQEEIMVIENDNSDEFSDWDDDEDEDVIGSKAGSNGNNGSSANALADAIIETVDRILPMLST